MGWGTLAIINLYDCNKETIRNKKKIKEFINRLCKRIEMEKEGFAKIKRFGKKSLKGYSAIQLIKTSSITLHFDEEENRAFLDNSKCLEAMDIVNMSRRIRCLYDEVLKEIL